MLMCDEMNVCDFVWWLWVKGVLWWYLCGFGSDVMGFGNLLVMFVM